MNAVNHSASGARAPRPAGPVLSVRALSAHYGKVAALDPIDLTVGAGEIVTVIGANGAGKSTLLGAIMGALPLRGHSRGSILFQGAEIQGWDIERRVGQGLSLVPERRELFASMSVRDNLLLGGFRLYRAGVRGWRDTLDEVYAHEAALATLYPGNNNVRPKIRQQLQVLRDRGWLAFNGRGAYRRAS